MAQLIPLLIVMAASAGFVFCDKCIRYKYIFPRDQGQRLYLRALTFGFPFVLFALLLNELLFWVPRLGIIPTIFELSRLEGALYASLLAGPYAWLCAICYNWIVGEQGRLEHFRKALLADDFDAVLWRSMSSLQPIAVSLENRKVYVGLVADGLEPGNDANSYLTILPLLSGHRAPDTMQFIISAAYEPVLDLLNNLPNDGDDSTTGELEAYYISFPRAKIISLHLFNDHLYAHVNHQYSAQDAT